tara:strand:+ start:499 stop:687 length:189 start_codon:yes stop_codon:yes gene_type:complete
MPARWSGVVVSTDGTRVILTVHGIRLELDPLEAMHISDTLRTMANRAITPRDGRAKKMGKEP